MRCIVGVLACLLLPVSAAADQLLYVTCSGDKRIEIHAIDGETGKLSAKGRVALAGGPGAMAIAPDRKHVYVATTRRENRARVNEIVTLARADDGSLKVVRSVKIDSRPAYLRVDPTGAFLLTAHYGSGQSMVLGIEGGVCTGKVTDLETTTRTAHCIELDPSGRFAFVPHTAPNRIYQYRFDAKTGQLTANQPAFVDGPDEEHDYHQPRHVRHHPKLKMMYSSNERGGGISAWKLADTGTLTRVQTLSTLPPRFEGKSAAAEVRITPDGRYAYVSNRDLARTEKGADTLTGFAIDPKSGKLTLVGHFPTARFPRSFTIDNRGAYLYAAGQRGAAISAYRIAGDTGKLVPVATYSVGKVPSWVMCVQK